MQGRKNQVAGQGCLNCVVGCFLVADFTDHQYVRVLAQDISENSGKGDADSGLYTDLVEVFHDHLYRVLDRDDVDFR